MCTIAYLGSCNLEARSRLLVVIESQVGYRSLWIITPVEVDSFFATLLENLDRFLGASGIKVIDKFWLEDLLNFFIVFEVFFRFLLIIVLGDYNPRGLLSLALLYGIVFYFGHRYLYLRFRSSQFLDFDFFYWLDFWKADRKRGVWSRSDLFLLFGFFQLNSLIVVFCYGHVRLEFKCIKRPGIQVRDHSSRPIPRYRCIRLFFNLPFHLELLLVAFQRTIHRNAIKSKFFLIPLRLFPLLVYHPAKNIIILWNLRSDVSLFAKNIK